MGTARPQLTAAETRRERRQEKTRGRACGGISLAAVGHGAAAPTGSPPLPRCTTAQLRLIGRSLLDSLPRSGAAPSSAGSGQGLCRAPARARLATCALPILSTRLPTSAAPGAPRPPGPGQGPGGPRAPVRTLTRAPSVSPGVSRRSGGQHVKTATSSSRVQCTPTTCDCRTGSRNKADMIMGLMLRACACVTSVT